MEIDIRTLVIILGFTHLMQFLVFFHQFRVIKTYHGIGWWLMWSIAEAIGFGFMLLRNIPSMLPFTIIVQNSMIVAGTVFLYFGVRRFFDRKVNLKLIIPVVSVFFAGMLYFLFIDENIRVRTVIISATLAIISFITAHSLIVNKIRSIRASANFNAVIFLVHGCIFLYHTVMVIAGAPVENFFTPILFNIVPFFDALIVSLLWTFGFIIMLNQRLNAEMTEAKEDLQLIFNTSPDAAVITRLDDGEIVDVNDGYTAITGYSREEMAGKSTPAINIWKNIANRKQVIDLLREKGHCENYEAVFVRKDGAELTGLLSAKIINIQDVPHIISITRNITERKRAEKDIELKNLQLRKMNAEKDRFFSIIAHDLRNPFNAFLGFTEILAEDFQSLASGEIQKIVFHLRNSAVNMFQLLENLLQWGKIQQGLIHVMPGRIRLQPMIDASMPALQGLIKNKEIEISENIPEDLMVFTDSNILQTILRNLISNALKFTPAKGKISISARSINDNNVEVAIKDSGIGMNSEIMDNLFSPAAKTNRSGTEGESSTGLGLIICKDFIEKQGGKIWVESEEGKGSTFYFTVASIKP